MLNEQELRIRILESFQKLILEHLSCIECHYLHCCEQKLTMNHSKIAGNNDFVIRVGVPSEGYTAAEYESFVRKILRRW